MYSTATGATGTGSASPNVTLPTSSNAKLAITASAQINPSFSANSLALCQLLLDEVALDTQQVTVPQGAATGGQSITLVGTSTAVSAGLVRVQCSATNDVTFSDIRIQAIQVDAID